MAISNKTRKLLWGKSGNRCAMCRKELSIDSTPKDDESIIGDECHIVSDQLNGPRYDLDFPINRINSYENLILLCKIHHKQIDDQDSTYTVEILKKIKENHEKWVSEQLKIDNRIDHKFRVKRIEKNIPGYLQRLLTGKEILEIIEGADTHSFEHDEFESKAEANLVAEFLQDISDWGDIGVELGPGERAKITFELTETIKELDAFGFWVFGAREKQIFEANAQRSNWFMAIIHVMRKTNNKIIKISLDKKIDTP